MAGIEERSVEVYCDEASDRGRKRKVRVCLGGEVCCSRDFCLNLRLQRVGDGKGPAIISLNKAKTEVVLCGFAGK